MNDSNQNNNGNIQEGDIPQSDIRFFTLEELKKYNGKDGMPAYVAMDGVVYDVSGSSLWDDGDHFGMISGRDLTIGYKTCHVGRPRIGIFPVVGYVRETDGNN